MGTVFLIGEMSISRIEKRKYTRVEPNKEEPVEVHLMGSTLIDVLEAKDISLGGIGILAPHHFDAWDLNQTIEVLVALPGELSDFLARGQIKQIGAKSQEKGIYGVQFTAIGPKGKRDLQVYINRMIRAKRKV